MMMYSRSSMIARRMVPMALRSRPLSVQTLAKVQDLESVLSNLHWTNCKDNVKEIRQLMNECKTNHAIRIPDDQLEHQVCARMAEIQSHILPSGTQAAHSWAEREAVNAEISGLKSMVKSELYGHPQVV